MAIQLDHHAWRSQARDDKHVFISRRAKHAAAIWLDCFQATHLAMTVQISRAVGDFFIGPA